MPRNGKVVYIEHYTTEIVSKLDNSVVLFGDNLRGVGSGVKSGQAVIRGLPNAYGIPTKKEPSTDEGAYFTDDEFEVNRMHILEAFQRLPLDKLQAGELTLVLPTHGIGTGKAQLPQRAPRTYQFLENLLAAYVSTIAGIPHSPPTQVA